MAGRTELDSVLDGMEGMAVEVAKVFKAYGPLPQVDSEARREQDSIEDEDEFMRRLLHDLPIRASLPLRAAGEAVEGVGRLLRLPPLAFMPGPVMRAGIASAGLVLWLLEEGIPMDTRLQRAMAMKREDLNYDLNLARASLRASVSSSEEIKAIEERAVAWSTAERERFLEAVAKSHFRLPSIPTETDLAALTDAQYEYHLTSGLAHGNVTAYGAVEKMLTGEAATPDSSGAMFFAYASTVSHSYCQAAWAFARYVLGNEGCAEVRRVLEAIYDTLYMNEEPRAYFRGA